jgi:hypothetical protein
VNGAPALRALPSGVSPSAPTITLQEAITLAVPLCFVVERDPLWADRAVDRVLELNADAGSGDLAGHRTVARWTRSRRWYSYTPYAFALGAADGPASQADALEEVARLSDHLGSARRGTGRHPLEGALFSMRGLQADLARPHAADVLLDAVRQLAECRGTLIVELEAAPAQDCPARGLGALVHLPGTPLVRYEAAVSEVLSAAERAGHPAPAPAAIADVLEGLSSLHALVAARMATAERADTRAGSDFLVVLSAARERVAAAMGAA